MSKIFVRKLMLRAWGEGKAEAHGGKEGDKGNGFDIPVRGDTNRKDLCTGAALDGGKKKKRLKNCYLHHLLC